MKLFILCMVGLIAAAVDSIAGGGGILTVPAYFWCGISPYYALGTNKFSATFGSLTSTISFIRSKKADTKLLKILLPFTFIGAVLGAVTALNVNEKILTSLVMVLILIVGVYSVFSKDIGMKDKFSGLNNKNIFLGVIFALVLGFYDGFFGPGTGSFLVFMLIKLYGYDFLNATGNAKAMNFTSNIASLLIFLFNKKVYFIYGIPVAICSIIGAFIGSKIAVKKGNKLIKPLFVTMALAASIKLLFKL